MDRPQARWTVAATAESDDGVGDEEFGVAGLHQGIVITTDMDQINELTRRVYILSIVQQVLSLITIVTAAVLAVSNVNALFSVGLLTWLLCCSAPLMAGMTCAGMQGWVSILAKDRLAFGRFVAWNQTCSTCWAVEVVLAVGMQVAALITGGDNTTATQVTIVVALNAAVAALQVYTVLRGRQLMRMPMESVWHIEAHFAVPVAQPVVDLVQVPGQPEAPPPTPTSGASADSLPLDAADVEGGAAQAHPVHRPASIAPTSSSESDWDADIPAMRQGPPGGEPGVAANSSPRQVQLELPRSSATYWDPVESVHDRRSSSDSVEDWG